MVPRPDDVMGEIGVAVVVPDRSLRTDPARRRWPSCARSPRTELAAHKLPEALVLVDQLPLTAMQKLDRRSIAAWPNSRCDRNASLASEQMGE